MKIVCISDTHGYLVPIPKCDLLLIAGDICPVYDHSLSFQERWIKDNFYPWLFAQPASKTVYIAGNHDFIFQDRPEALTEYITNVDRPMGIKNVYYLQDSYVNVDGLIIWGSPWQLPFGGWAFNASEAEIALALHNMPEKIDVLLTHGPPYGILDGVYEQKCIDSWPEIVHTGSITYKNIIIEKRPKLAVCGHIHCAAGQEQIGKTLVVNASIVDENYKLKHKAFEVECI
jgi:Icc-related predicted phosphoesterase